MRSLQGVVAELPCSERQARYWVNRGWVQCSWEDLRGEPVAFGGTGFRQMLNSEQEAALRLFAELAEFGLEPCRIGEIVHALGSEGVATLRGLAARKKEAVGGW